MACHLGPGIYGYICLRHVTWTDYFIRPYVCPVDKIVSSLSANRFPEHMFYFSFFIERSLCVNLLYKNIIFLPTTTKNFIIEEFFFYKECGDFVMCGQKCNIGIIQMQPNVLLISIVIVFMIYFRCCFC